MAKVKASPFPKLIHVTREPDNDEPYLVVHEKGIYGLDESGQSVAIYQLVEEGHVNILKTFISKKGRK